MHAWLCESRWTKYQLKAPLPFVPPSEYAGVIAAVGAGVTGLKAGLAVAPMAELKAACARMGSRAVMASLGMVNPASE